MSISTTAVATITSDFLTCTPFPATTTVTDVFTTTQTLIALAACPTSAWTATYIFVEVCTGNPKTYTPPPMPNNFVETTVVCDVCATPTMAITCPVNEAMRTGDMTIQGNGVTAGPTGVAPMTDMPAATGRPLVTAGASSLKRGLLLAVPAVLAAGQLLL